MATNPYEKYLGPEDKLQREVMQYIGMQYPKALITHPANEGKRSKFEQYKLKTLGVMEINVRILTHLPFSTGR